MCVEDGTTGDGVEEAAVWFSIVLLCSMVLDLCVCWGGTGWWVSAVEKGEVSASTIGPYSSWNTAPESFTVRVRMRGLHLRRVWLGHGANWLTSGRWHRDADAAGLGF